jgi:hypothetical protein
MLRKWKLLLATSAFVIAGFAGFAVAKGGSGAHGGKAGMLKKFDEDGDGKLSDAEKAKMQTVFAAKRAKRQAEALSKYDSNKDGTLDRTEKKAMRDDRTAERFKKLDKDGDGKLSLDEFQSGGGMGKHRGHRGGHGKH